MASKKRNKFDIDMQDFLLEDRRSVSAPSNPAKRKTSRARTISDAPEMFRADIDTFDSSDSKNSRKSAVSGDSRSSGKSSRKASANKTAQETPRKSGGKTAAAKAGGGTRSAFSWDGVSTPGDVDSLEAAREAKKAAAREARERDEANKAKRRAAAEAKKREEAETARKAAALEAKKREADKQAKRRAALDAKKRKEAIEAKQAALEAKKREEEALAKKVAALEAKKREEEALAKKVAALEAKKREEEALAKKVAALEAKKREEETLAKKVAALEAKKREEEALAKKVAALEAKKREEEALAKKAAALEAKKREAEALAKKAREEELERRRKEQEEIARKRKEQELARIRRQRELLAEKRRREELAQKERDAAFLAEMQAKGLERKQRDQASKAALSAIPDTVIGDNLVDDIARASDNFELAEHNGPSADSSKTIVLPARDNSAAKTSVFEIEPEELYSGSESADSGADNGKVKSRITGGEASDSGDDKASRDGLLSKVRNKFKTNRSPSEGREYNRNNIIKRIFLPKEKPVTIKAKAMLALRYVAIFMVTFCFMGMSYTTYAIATAPKIDPKNIYDSISQGSVIYDQNDNEVTTIDNGQKREIVEFKDMPDDLVDAVVALEDKTFWDHHGFNWIRMGGAVLEAITNGGQVSGTSTITQQLARNVYLPEIKSERSIKRKIIEMYYSYKIEKDLSKEEIFAAYMNSIYFGFGNYGIKTASETYFSKPVNELNLVECATMAALPQSPDSYALIEYMTSEEASKDYTRPIEVNGTEYLVNDLSKDRRDLCLSLMLEQKYITHKEYEDSEGKNLADYIKPTIKEPVEVATYFKDYAVDQVIDDLMKEYNLEEQDAYNMVYAGGLKIYTTMDLDAQKSIEKEFSDDSNFPGYTNLNKNKDGDVVTDSGDISLYNYDNYFNSKGNFVLKKGEFILNDDGSLTIIAHKRLYFYVTETSSGTDYSIEFKPTYEIKDGKMYIHSGGYINIPITEKTMDENDNITINAEYVKSHPELMHISESSPDRYVFTPESYTLEPGVIQPQAAMVIVDNTTGQLKAMVGGRGIKGNHLYNRAIADRQPGSSFKPLAVYAAALQKSYEYEQNGKKFEFTDYGIDKQGTSKYGDYLTAASIVVDEPTTIEGRVWPINATHSYSGNITMRKALQNSVNVSAVKTFLQVGAEYSADLVEKFGITTLVRSGEYSDLNPSGLGMGGLSEGVSPLEMAEAYTVFPNGGVRHTVTSYTKVEDRHGKTILTATSESVDVLNEGVAFIMTDMLKSVVSQGIGRNAAISGVQVGGKTGTTSNNYDIWFDGFTPSYSAVLWIGSDINISLTSDSSSAALLWSKIMRNIPDALKGSYKPQPDNVVKYRGEYFTTGTQSGAPESPTNNTSKDTDNADSTTENNNSSNGSNPINPGDASTPDTSKPNSGTDDNSSGSGSGNTGGDTGGSGDSGDSGGDTGGTGGSETPDAGGEGGETA